MRPSVSINLRLGGLLIAALLLASPFQVYSAQSGCMDSSRLGPDHYIKPSQVDLVSVLGPPPSPDSPQGRDDLNAVLDAQRERTPAEISQVRVDSCFSIFAFAAVMGPGFTAARLPFTVAFFQRVFDDGMNGVADAKRHFNRPRPFVQNKQVTPALPQPSNASYPSGHATFAYMTAILLADIAPEKAGAIFSRAAAFAHSRLIAGVHYPSDLLAGRIAAAVIDNVLLDDAAFDADLAKARSEVRGATGLPSR